MTAPTPTGQYTPPSAPEGMVLVSKAFLRALLHDSACDIEPWATRKLCVDAGERIGKHDVCCCPDPDHGLSFGELRELAEKMVK